MILNAEDKIQRDQRDRERMRSNTLKSFHEDKYDFFRRSGLAESTDEEIVIWESLPTDSEIFDQFFDHLVGVCARRRKARGIPEPEVPLTPEEMPVDPEREAEVRRVNEQVAAFYEKRKAAANAVHSALVDSMRSASVVASREHQRENPDECVVLALKSEKQPDQADCVRLIISKHWFESLTRDLAFWHPSWNGAYRLDAAGYPEMLQRVIKGALFCRVSFNNGDATDLRVQNLTIHRGYGEDEAKNAFLNSTREGVVVYDFTGEMPVDEGGELPEERCG